MTTTPHDTFGPRDFRATSPGPIGTHGLIGCVRGEYLLVGGVNGGDFVMCNEAGLELRDWLTQNLTPRNNTPALAADVATAEAATRVNLGVDAEQVQIFDRALADALQAKVFQELETSKDIELQAWRAATALQADAWRKAAAEPILPTGTI